MELAPALALISGFLHAGWNVLAKRFGNARGATLAILTMDLVLMVLAYPFLPHRMHVNAVPWVCLSALGEAGYVISLGIALSKGDLGVTYGVSRGIALLTVWPLGYVIFGDVPSSAAWIATALLCAGMLLSQPRASDAVKSKMSFAWTLSTGLCVGIYHTGYKGAVHAGANAITTFALSIALAVPLLWVVSSREVRASARELFRVRPAMLTFAGMMSAGSFVLAVVALSATQSGRVLGLRNGSIGYTALFAFWMGERPASRQWAGLALLFAGVVVLALWP